MHYDEDETVEVVSLGGGVRTINVGLDHAKQRARSAYLEGQTSVEEYEGELDRLLRKEAALAPHA